MRVSEHWWLIGLEKNIYRFDLCAEHDLWLESVNGLAMQIPWASMSRALSSGILAFGTRVVVSVFYSELPRKICLGRGPIQLYNSGTHSGLRVWCSSQHRACRFFANRRTPIACFPFDSSGRFTRHFAPSLHVGAVGNGSFHWVPSRSIAHSFTRSLRATATMAIFFRLSLPRRTCS